MCREKIHSRYSSAGGIMKYFWAYFGYIPECLGKLKTSLDILHKCLYITVVVAEIKNVLDLPLLWKIWVFLVRFLVYF